MRRTSFSELLRFGSAVQCGDPRARAIAAGHLRRPGRQSPRGSARAGLPAGGLFTGAEGIKTAAEAAVYDGDAGEPYDPCYHLGCDTMGNLSTTALEQMADGAAHATISLGMSTEAINGERGKGNFNVPGFPVPQPQRSPKQ